MREGPFCVYLFDGLTTRPSTSPLSHTRTHTHPHTPPVDHDPTVAIPLPRTALRPVGNWLMMREVLRQLRLRKWASPRVQARRAASSLPFGRHCLHMRWTLLQVGRSLAESRAGNRARRFRHCSRRCHDSYRRRRTASAASTAGWQASPDTARPHQLRRAHPVAQELLRRHMRIQIRHWHYYSENSVPLKRKVPLALQAAVRHTCADWERVQRRPALWRMLMKVARAIVGARNIHAGEKGVGFALMIQWLATVEKGRDMNDDLKTHLVEVSKWDHATHGIR